MDNFKYDLHALIVTVDFCLHGDDPVIHGDVERMLGVIAFEWYRRDCKDLVALTAYENCVWKIADRNLQTHDTWFVEEEFRKLDVIKDL